MKNTFVLLPVIILATIVTQKNEPGIDPNSYNSNYSLLNKDTPNPKTLAFEVFAKKYFDAVRKKDTAYLKQHTIFPIGNFPGFQNKKINQSFFCKNLYELFDPK